MVLRCFIAIEIPQSVKKSIGNIIDILKKSDADVKWVHENNIHITIKFLGNTDDSVITPIKDALHKKILPYSPFYIRIYGAGCFPDERHPRVIWVGIEGSELLKKLQKDIDSEMVNFGFSQEKRNFSPHLTIGRVRSKKRIPEMIKKLKEFRTLEFSELEINRLSLIKSELNPAGAKYYTLAEIPFGRRNNVK